jgi:hypothetical protein
MNWRTAHLVVSGSAFAVWTAASVSYFVICENAITPDWCLYGPAAALPAFGCVYAWFAARRADSKTSERLTTLAVPVLVMGLGMLLVVIGDVTAEHPGGVGGRPIGMGTGMVGQCCWTPSAVCGYISFVWGIVLQVIRLRQPRDES